MKKKKIEKRLRERERERGMKTKIFTWFDYVSLYPQDGT